jgi:hypothetical protein
MQALAQLPGAPDSCTSDVLNDVAFGVASSAYQVGGDGGSFAMLPPLYFVAVAECLDTAPQPTFLTKTTNYQNQKPTNNRPRAPR